MTLNFLKKHKYFFLSILGALILVILDQITKIAAKNAVEALMDKTMGVHYFIRVTPFFNLVSVLNEGVSFGMFRNLTHGAAILSAITIAIIFLIGYLMFRHKNQYQLASLAIILAGAIGNLIDRIKIGAVIDFLDFHIGSFHWPAFNLADSLVVVGVFLLLLEDIIIYRKSRGQKHVEPK